MKRYTRLYEADSSKEYKAWVTDLIKNKSLNYHPDEDFKGYTDKSGKPTFSDLEAKELQAKLNRFHKELGDDVYKLGEPILRKAVGLKEKKKEKKSAPVINTYEGDEALEELSVLRRSEGSGWYTFDGTNMQICIGNWDEASLEEQLEDEYKKATYKSLFSKAKGSDVIDVVLVERV